MNTAYPECHYCGGIEQDRIFGHFCQTDNLPAATQRNGRYALRHHGAIGYMLWNDIGSGEFQGKSYTLGAVLDPENFHYAVEAAEEESRVLLAQAREEFGV